MILGDLDCPLLVEWPSGERAALLFVIEEESDPKRFSVPRLAHYCLTRLPRFDLFPACFVAFSAVESPVSG